MTMYNSSSTPPFLLSLTKPNLLSHDHEDFRNAPIVCYSLFSFSYKDFFTEVCELKDKGSGTLEQNGVFLAVQFK